MSPTNYLFVDPQDTDDKRSVRSHVARECRRRRTPLIARPRKFDLRFELKSPQAKTRIHRFQPHQPAIQTSPRQRLQHKRARSLSLRPQPAFSYKNDPYSSIASNQSTDEEQLQIASHGRDRRSGGTQRARHGGTVLLDYVNKSRQVTRPSLKTSSATIAGSPSTISSLGSEEPTWEASPKSRSSINSDTNFLDQSKNDEPTLSSSIIGNQGQEVLRLVDRDDFHRKGSASNMRKNKYGSVSLFGAGPVDPFQAHPATALGPSVSKLIDYSQSLCVSLFFSIPLPLSLHPPLYLLASSWPR